MQLQELLINLSLTFHTCVPGAISFSTGTVIALTRESEMFLQQRLLLLCLLLQCVSRG